MPTEGPAVLIRALTSCLWQASSSRSTFIAYSFWLWYRSAFRKETI